MTAPTTSDFNTYGRAFAMMWMVGVLWEGRSSCSGCSSTPRRWCLVSLQAGDRFLVAVHHVATPANCLDEGCVSSFLQMCEQAGLCVAVPSTCGGGRWQSPPRHPCLPHRMRKCVGPWRHGPHHHAPASAPDDLPPPSPQSPFTTLDMVVLIDLLYR
jgi:hypothetical protein